MVRKKMIVPVLILACLVSAGAPRKIRRGNRLFEKEKYNPAMQAYNAARTDLPESPVISYNQGNVFYRLNQFQEAVQAFSAQIQRETGVTNRASGWYNMGNAYFKSENYQGAVDAYKQCLRLTPDDDDARYNLELALRMLQQQTNQQQQTNEQNNQDEPQNGQQSQDEQQQQGQQGEENIPPQSSYTAQEAMRILEQLEDENQTIIPIRGGSRWRDKDW